MDGRLRVAELPASRGAGWIRESFQLFRGAPIAWIGLSAGWITITFALILIPILGGVVANFLQPAFFASFAIAGYKQASGTPIAMSDLFAGFRHNLRALVNLGAIMLLAEIAIFALMALLGLPLSGPDNKTFTFTEYVEALRDKEWILALGFLLTMIVKGALWFAPQLIAFHGMTTMHAIRWSLYAAMANLGPMIVYGAVLFGIFFVALLPWALGLLVVIPLLVISSYVSYREVFEAAGVAPSAP